MKIFRLSTAYLLLFLLLAGLCGCLHSTVLPAVLPVLPASDTTDSSDSTVSPDTTVPPDTTASPDTTVPPDTTAAPDTTMPPDTTAAPDTTVPPDTTAAPDTTVPPDTTAVPETRSPEPEQIDPEKVIYLTFDDGPTREKTAQVLDILAEYDVRATFFVVGMFVDYYPEQTRMIVEAGHALGCHSYSHRYETLYTSVDGLTEDLDAWEHAVAAALGGLPEAKLFRFPGGSNGYSLVQNPLYPALCEAIAGAGYHAFDWSAGNNDLWLGMKTEEMTMEEYLMFSLEASLRLIRNKPDVPKIILMHETSDDTIAALPAMLDYLIAQGYIFRTLDEYPADYLIQSLR